VAPPSAVTLTSSVVPELALPAASTTRSIPRQRTDSRFPVITISRLLVGLIAASLQERKVGNELWKPEKENSTKAFGSSFLNRWRLVEGELPHFGGPDDDFQFGEANKNNFERFGCPESVDCSQPRRL
jgi:hypothetical protein